jgi:hypothetical protein
MIRNKAGGRCLLTAIIRARANTPAHVTLDVGA